MKWLISSVNLSSIVKAVTPRSPNAAMAESRKAQASCAGSLRSSVTCMKSVVGNGTAYTPSSPSSPTTVLLRLPPTIVMSMAFCCRLAPMTISWLKALVSTPASALAELLPVT